MEEKVNFQNSEGKTLVGVLHLPKQKTDKIIILAHGFTSNKNRERYILIGEALVNEGYAFLRFDFGGSDNCPNITGIKSIKDNLFSA